MMPFGLLPGEFTLEVADVILIVNALAFALIALVTFLPDIAAALARLRDRLRPPRPGLGR